MNTMSHCTPEQQLSFLQLYFATVDLLTEAQEKYRRLIDQVADISQRSHYRALLLESERDLELMKNQRRAFLTDQLAIRPPSPSTVQNTITNAEKLAQTIADVANANAIINLASMGLMAFNAVLTA